LPILVALGLVHASRLLQSEATFGTPRTYDAGKDPRPGTTVLRPASLTWLRKPTKGTYFAIAVGTCAACSVNTLDHARLKALPQRPLVAIIQGTEKLGDRAKTDYAGFDAYVQLTAAEYRALNPAWTHRAYRLDEDGRIARCQPWGSDLEEFNRS
jgi:hypothetical protein